MTTTPNNPSPREIIDDIRTSDYLLDLSGESAKVQKGARSLQQKLNRTLRLLSEDLYSKQTHFVLELVQNADDNDYPSRTIPNLTFKLSPNKLVLINNETGFSEKHVRFLCDVGKSSKTSKKGYIGEKGIGFKSVFTVSDRPEIHSNGFHFRFDRDNETNLLGYVVPIWCDVAAEAVRGQTCILLPAKPTVTFGAETLDELDPHLLLFLHKLRRISIEHGHKMTSFSRKDTKRFTHLTKQNGAEATQLHFFRTELPVSTTHISDDKRPDCESTTIVLAFPVDESGAAKSNPTSQVFAFLPIREFGFKFSIHADFVLSSSREGILTERPWNRFLRDQLPLALAAAVAEFRSTEQLRFTYLRFLPTASETLDPFFRPVVGPLYESLSQTECLPSASGEWRRPDQLRYGHRPFRELFPSDLAVQLFGFDYVDERVQVEDAVLKRLGAQAISYTDYVNFFARHEEWLRNQPLSWKAKLYATLAELSFDALLKAEILDVACIPTTGGNFVAPASASTFYPLSRARRYGFEDDLTIVDVEILDEAAKHSSKIPTLFERLGVKLDQPYQMVESFILKQHEGDRWTEANRKSLVGHIRYIKDKLSSYLLGATEAGLTSERALDRLRAGLWIGTKSTVDDVWMFKRLDELYLGKEYAPAFCLETLLESSVSAEMFVSPEYLSARAKDTAADKASWSEFFLRLGVQPSPALRRWNDGDWDFSDELALLLHSTTASVRRVTLECLDAHWSRYAASVTYPVKAGRYSHADVPTLFAKKLRSVSAPTRRRMQLALSESYFPSKELKDVLGENAPYVEAKLKNERMLDACGITYRLDWNACIRRLQQMRDSGNDTGEQLHAIYRALERLWGTDGSSIKHTFEEEPLIRVRGPHARWATTGEVTWRSNGRFLDSLYPPLQGQYRDFSGLFQNKLGVPRELSTDLLVRSLPKLGAIADSEDRIREATHIYLRANKALASLSDKDSVSEPDWMDVFRTEAVFATLNHGLVENSEQLFANDLPAYGELFGDCNEVSLLAISYDDLPRVRHLLQEAGVRLVSECIAVDVERVEGGVEHPALSRKVRTCAPFLERILYFKEHDAFESAMSSGSLQDVRRVTVLEAPDLKLRVELGGVSRIAAADTATKEQDIFVRRGAKAVTHRIASELCRFVGMAESYSDIVSLLLSAPTTEDAEDLLELRGIRRLPSTIAVAASETEPEEEFANGTSESSGSVDDPPQELSLEADAYTDNESPTLSGERATQRSRQVTDDVAAAGEAHASPDNHGREHSKRGSERTNLDSPGRGASASQEESETVAAPPKEPQMARSAFNPVDAGRPESEIVSESQASVEHSNAPDRAVTPLNRGAFAGLGLAAPRVETTRDARKNGRKSRRERTKSGRLLSYAASPKEAARTAEGLANDLEAAERRNAVGQAAVDYFIASQGELWKSLTPMEPNNPGFDVTAIALDGETHFIEVKGQSNAWTEAGVALTPREVIEAEKRRKNYWLCVVEYVNDAHRRRLYMINDPFGLTNEFRFDHGWKSIAQTDRHLPLRPEVGNFVEISGEGRGEILSLHKKGQFYRLHVMLDNGKQINKLFNPATMKLSSG